MKIKLDEYKDEIPAAKKKRINILKNEFMKLYGCEPQFYVRTPGRVNIIGEHIDYSGYGVLPLAIDNDIIIAISKRIDNVLNLGNLNQFLYKPILIDLDANKQLEKDNPDIKNLNAEEIFVDSHSPKWHDYFLAGFKGAIIKIKETIGLNCLLGMNIMISSNLPACSGLSSSSALVCGASLCALLLHKVYLTRLEMAQLCASSERYIGTYGGGMDQAICFLSREHQATLINFNPVTAQAIKIPASGQFVIANSCAPMDKGNTPHYNIRVCECRLAAQAVFKLSQDAISKAASRELNNNGWKEIDTIKQMEKMLKVESLPELGDLFKKYLKTKPYSEGEIMDILGIKSRVDFVEHCLRNKVLPENQEFKLLDRALHVCQEAQRVVDFTKICDNVPANENEQVETLRKLGVLMNDSHSSCRDLFECSHPKLEELVSICREYGALGSRLTGAGWGGCCVSLVPKTLVPQFIEKVSAKFYRDPGSDVQAGDTGAEHVSLNGSANVGEEKLI